MATSATIGFPRIGGRREIKTALERHWKGALPLADLLTTCEAVENQAWTSQKAAGIDLIGLDGTAYDHVLDTTTWLGVAPARFEGLEGHAKYFAMARGAEGRVALDMTKLFDTNYHYMVPELEANFKTNPDLSVVLSKVERGQALLGKSAAIPMIVGPVSFVYMARGAESSNIAAVRKLLPAYVSLLEELKKRGVPEVQIHEPFLVTSRGASLKVDCEEAYAALAAVALPINLVTYYDDLGEAYQWVVKLPVATISMDFRGVPGAAPSSCNRSLELVRTHGFPADKNLGAGVVDGRSVWADEQGKAAAILKELRALGLTKIIVHSSVPLQHLPIDTAMEVKMPVELRNRMAFAVQKLTEVKTLSASTDASPSAPVAAAAPDIGSTLDRAMFDRPQPFAQRRDSQLQFPAFPTTTIGSFPQTAELRRLRLQKNQGKITAEEYAVGIAGHIGFAIGMQEALGLDVLVHGEAERTDMVEYFGQKLEGMAFSEHGWVQSYGSRYIRPPIIVGDIRRTGDMTVVEFKQAQALTTLPVKGMLTGPVTILNWSFPRVDVTRQVQAFQLALALREEVLALEVGGCRIVQVDEPALREGLPLKKERWDAYLEWAVDAFRLCCGVAAPATQVVTHLCYSSFEDIMGAIDRMDADVLTIENSRSDDEMIAALAATGYGRDIGPGVYDVHSPVVPTVEFIKSKLRSFVHTGILGGRTDRIWCNPDCGLKTRGWPETIGALANMVAAAKQMRAELAAPGGIAPADKSAVKAVAAPGAGHPAGCCN